MVVTLTNSLGCDRPEGDPGPVPATGLSDHEHHEQRHQAESVEGGRQAFVDVKAYHGHQKQHDDADRPPHELAQEKVGADHS